jgi:hypothetical protein
MIERFLKDSLFNGILLGTLSVLLDYVFLYNVDRVINLATSYGHVLKAPRLQLIILGVNIILFRFLIVRWQRIETGKGVLLVLIAATGYYIYNRHNPVITEI